MEDIAMIALLIGGLVGIIQHNGGIDWLLQFVRSKVKSKRGAELGIASLVSAADISTANNTISIIMAGPLKILQMNMMLIQEISKYTRYFGGCFQDYYRIVLK